MAVIDLFMEVLLKYFPDLDKRQVNQFSKLFDLYSYWNERINLISRKDMENFYLHHVLHSLAVVKTTGLPANSKVIDVGTGGGFPGIPLAVFYPEISFFLIDSTGKKIKVVDAVARELNLNNIETQQIRAENVNGKFDYSVVRAVAKLDQLVKWTKPLLKRNSEGGVITLKGGSIKEEVGSVNQKTKIYPIEEIFEEDYFKEKYVLFTRFNQRFL